MQYAITRHDNDICCAINPAVIYVPNVITQLPQEHTECIIMFLRYCYCILLYHTNDLNDLAYHSFTQIHERTIDILIALAGLNLFQLHC